MLEGKEFSYSGCGYRESTAQTRLADTKQTVNNLDHGFNTYYRIPIVREPYGSSWFSRRRSLVARTGQTSRNRKDGDEPTILT
jgi:hypothetical protein